MRQIVLDTETTGLDPNQGHRVIEIGCVELINRRLTNNNYHQYLNPQRDIDEGALEVHGLTPEFLSDKPVFEEVMADFIEYIRGAELVIHNAPFDVGFLNSEFKKHSEAGQITRIEDICTVLDTLALARKMHPGKKNNLDALCKRYDIDNTQRTLHGALLDSEILADTYLAMTGGQASLSLVNNVQESSTSLNQPHKAKSKQRPRTRIILASGEELARHKERLEFINSKSDNKCIWLESNTPEIKTE